MSKSYDLHSHTLHSDGTLTPTELVQRAVEKGVDVLALTDHDVTDGIGEARQVAQQLGIRLVPGVEVSTSWEGTTIHVVGLDIDIENKPLQQGLADLRRQRNERALEIAAGLEKVGITGTHEGASRLAKGKILSRTHFARYLVEAGHAGDMGKAFRKYLRKGKAGFVRSEWCTLEQGVEWIRAAGGRAVIAHPERYTMGRARMERLLSAFRESGGAGIEVVSGSHTPGGVEKFGRMACDFELLASRGSDFHGPETHWIELGRLPQLPEYCVPVWHDDFGASPGR
ncbi:MAG: PHP domain-containing protein [Acidiferrobacterales bacterium]|nr:PHP domain-containing protein [Acidiferrobacterales bacterium]